MKTQSKEMSRILSEVAKSSLLKVVLPVEWQNAANTAFIYVRMLPQTIVILACLFGLTIPATAGSLPASIQVTETMMSASGFDAFSIVEAYGLDPSAVLQFSSYIDPHTGAFSYSLLPGQTYLGEPLSLATVGTYNPNTSTYSWTMTGEYRGQALSGSGTAYWFGDPEQEVTQRDDESAKGVKGDYSEYKGTVNVKDDGTSDFKNLKVHSYRGGYGSDAKISGTDTYTTTKGVNTYTWTATSAEGLSLDEGGSDPFGGGPGFFTIEATATPEPSSLLLLGSGILGLAGVLRKRLIT